MIILNIRNAQQSGKETEQILQAINHKDFSLFPDKKQNDPLKQKAVDLYYQEKEKYRCIVVQDSVRKYSESAGHRYHDTKREY